MKQRRLGWQRIPDLLAIAIIVFVAFKLFIAPHLLSRGIERAPVFALDSMAGPQFRLADQRGKVVFLDFWASWCEPCKVSLPMVERFATAHPKVVVAAIDVGEDPITARAFAQRLKLHGVVFDPAQQAAGLYGVSGLPSVVAIDPAGYVRARWIGFNPTIEIALANATKKLSLPVPVTSR